MPTLIKRLEQVRVPDAYIGTYILPRPQDLVTQMAPLGPVLRAFDGPQVSINTLCGLMGDCNLCNRYCPVW